MKSHHDHAPTSMASQIDDQHVMTLTPFMKRFIKVNNKGLLITALSRQHERDATGQNAWK